MTAEDIFPCAAPTPSTAALIGTPGPSLFPELMRDDVFRLSTRRLWLRWPRRADAKALEAYAARAEVAEMTGSWPHPLPPGEVDSRILTARKHNAAGKGLILAIALREAPTVQIGSIGVSAILDGGDETEALSKSAGLGYMLHPDHWGQGLMTEAVQAVLDAVFLFSHVREVKAWTRADNPRSEKVLLRSGFSRIGSKLKHLPARGGMLPCVEFSRAR